MKKIAYLLCLIYFSSASYSNDIVNQKWFLEPKNQEVLIDINDLYSEKLYADPSLDWGYQFTQNLELQKEIKVAVIDSGLDRDHPALLNSLGYKSVECYDGNTIPQMEEDQDGNGKQNDCLGWNFVAQSNDIDDDQGTPPYQQGGHGTHVSGLILDVFGRQKEFVKIIPLKVFDQRAEKDRPLPTKFLEAFQYAIEEKVDVIHLSMGWPETLMSSKLLETIEEAIGKGIVIVSAAGNSSQRANIYPCKISGVICVGALRANGSLASFSNRGPQLDFLAPGEKILSTIPLSVDPLYFPVKGYDFKNGTSQAAPLVTGAISFLKALYPEESSHQLYARLVATATPSELSLKGMFNLEKAILLKKTDYVIPSFKHLNILKNTQRLNFSIKLRNYSVKKTIQYHAKLRCGNEEISLNESIQAQENKEVSVSISNSSLNSELNCLLEDSLSQYHFNIKLVNQFPERFLNFEFSDDQQVMKKVRDGVFSRLITLASVNSEEPEPFYFVLKEKEASYFYLNKLIGKIQFEEGCKHLRSYQSDFNLDGEQDFLVESYCKIKSETCENQSKECFDSFLKYSYFNQQMENLYPAITFRPDQDTLNYEDFLVLKSKDKPPVFRFFGFGPGEASSDPWEDNDANRSSKHLYEMSAVDSKDGLSYKTTALDNRKTWAKNLGYRYTPKFSYITYTEKEVLVQVEGKTFWINTSDQKIRNANLDFLLLGADSLKKISNGEEAFLNAFLTPYEFRAAKIEGDLVLRYRELDYGDPLEVHLGTVKTAQGGYRVYLKTFNHILSLSYDSFGQLISSEKKVIERFDFLNGDQINSLVAARTTQNGLSIIMDGTKIHTDYLDIYSGEKRSFFISKDCSSQLPIFYQGKNYLTLSCVENNKQKIRLVDLLSF